MPSLEHHSAEFAEEIQRILDAVLPGARTVISSRFWDTDRYLVAHNGETAKERRMPLYVAASTWPISVSRCTWTWIEPVGT